jgi:hypothetical protein
MNHGAREPFFGVKVEDLKKIQKRVKQNHELALALYDTGISDAMYLAGLIAEPPKMTKAHFNRWVKAAYWSMLSEYTVPWVASESRFAMELAEKWIASPKEGIAAAGWNTYSSFAMLTPDEHLDLPVFEKLLERVQTELPTSANRVRYTMNGFVIAVGGSVVPLNAKAKKIAASIGTVSVDMGGTACKVPLATDYIAKIESMGRLGKKRKSARC